MKKGVKGFLGYAIREVILVVIGILIAVSINNANEARKSKKMLEGILTTYKDDLKIDTLATGQILGILEAKKALFQQFLSDTVTKEMYQKNTGAFGLALSYVPFELQKKGVESLKRFDSDSKKSDSLVIRILANHSTFDHLFDAINKNISEDVSENMQYLKTNEPWIGDLLMGRINNPEMWDYYVSKTYAARLAIRYNLEYKNLEPYLLQYKKVATQILQDLEQRLQEE